MSTKVASAVSSSPSRGLQPRFASRKNLSRSASKSNLTAADDDDPLDFDLVTAYLMDDGLGEGGASFDIGMDFFEDDQVPGKQPTSSEGEMR